MTWAAKKCTKSEYRRAREKIEPCRGGEGKNQLRERDQFRRELCEERRAFLRAPPARKAGIIAEQTSSRRENFSVPSFFLLCGAQKRKCLLPIWCAKN